MRTTQDTLANRVGSLLGQNKPASAGVCFNCAGSTALGRMTTVVAGEKVESCMKEECRDQLQALIARKYASAN